MGADLRTLVLVLALFSGLLLFGCLQQPPASQVTGKITVNQSSTTPVFVNATANQTPIAIASGPNKTNQTNQIFIQATDNQSSNASNTTPVQKPEGLEFANGSYVLVLDDVSVTSSQEPCGIFSIRYQENGSLITNFMTCPPDSKYWRSPEGRTYRIRVEKVAAGYTKETKWASVTIFG